MSADDLSTLSIKALKEIIARAGMTLPGGGGIEKPELVAIAQLAQAKLDQQVHFPVFKEQGCPVETCRAIFLFFHGYGADEHQFDFFVGHHPEIALITPKSDSEGWWPLNVMEWAQAMRDPAALLRKVEETPSGLVRARERAIGFVQQLLRRAPANAKLLIGGFSQGGAMAVDLALHLPKREQVVFVGAFSSFPVCLSEWRERAKSANIRALVTHGTADPIVPFFASNIMQSVLSTRGEANVEFAQHSGGHTLGDAAVLARCKAFFDRALE